jgi:arginase
VWCRREEKNYTAWMKPGKVAVYGVPTSAATRVPGVERASWVLRQEGLLAALRARGATVVHLSDLSLFAHRDDPGHPKERNVPVVACAVRTGADEMTRALDEGFAVLLGGDCTMGAAAAMGASRRLGRQVGIVWLDGDADLNTPETTPSGYLEGMALALALGRGSAEVTGISGPDAATSEDRVALLGYRALDEGEKPALARLGLALDVGAVRTGGAADVASRALAVAGRDGAPVVVHLDVDVLDAAELPARNHATPGGLTRLEAGALLQALLAHPQVVALSMAGYNPEKDPDRVSARLLVELLAEAIGPRVAAAIR